MEKAAPGDDWAVWWVKYVEFLLAKRGAVHFWLLRQGLEWLTTAREHRLWASVFLRLWALNHERGALRSLAREWVELHPTGRRAAEVCKALRMEAPTQPVPHSRRTERGHGPDPAELFRFIESIAVPMAFHGQVKDVQDYGVFVSVGPAVGLLHVSRLAATEGSDLRARFKKGQAISVVVTDVDPVRGRLSLMLDPGSDSEAVTRRSGSQP